MFILSDTKIKHTRVIYNSLDFLGDIGGLIDALKLIAAMLVSIFGNRNLMNGLIARLFFTIAEVKDDPIDSVDKD